VTKKHYFNNLDALNKVVQDNQEFLFTCLLLIHFNDSSVTKGAEGACSPWRSRRGGAKQHHQKYFNDHKSDFDEGC